MAFCPLAVCPLTPVSNYRQNVVFHQYGTYTDIFHLPLRSLPVWGLFFWNLKISFSAKLGLAIKSHSFLPKVAVFKGFRGHPMFALMPCFKRTLTLLLVLIIRIILSTYKFFPSSYAFFIISTWSSAVFAASIPPPPTMPFKEAFSKKEVPHHAPLLLLPLHTHLQVYQNCCLLEDLSIWSILFLP